MSIMNKLFHRRFFNINNKKCIKKACKFYSSVGGSSNGYLPFPEGFTYKTIHSSYNSDETESLALVPPLVTSTTFKQPLPGKPLEFSYSRLGNPVRKTLENCLASLENGKHGFCFSSGLGAATSLLGLLKTGDHLVCGEDHYAGVLRIFRKFGTRFGIEPTFVDVRDKRNVENALKSNTKLIFVETLSNPTLRVADIRGIAEIAKRNNVLLAVDNTFLTPFLTNALNLGADIVMHSVTKYLNGHTDVVMGAIITNRDELKENFSSVQEDLGIVPSPFDCYMVLRGLKTLELRMLKHMENAMKVAEFLENHPKIEKVVYPGLPSHTEHNLFKKQTSGPSGMCSIYLKGKINETLRFLKALKVLTLADSLGGYESLANVSALMTHACLTPELKKKQGITDNLIRLSIGLEDASFIIRDLEQALDQI